MTCLKLHVCWPVFLWWCVDVLYQLHMTKHIDSNFCVFTDSSKCRLTLWQHQFTRIESIDVYSALFLRKLSNRKLNPTSTWKQSSLVFFAMLQRKETYEFELGARKRALKNVTRVWILFLKVKSSDARRSKFTLGNYYSLTYM